MKNFLLSIAFTLFLSNFSNAQSCSPQGNETSYGSNNVWIGYVYNKANFTQYKGYVNEGYSASPNFDEDFGGNNTNYNTNGCSVKTESFSVRYKLTKTFTSGSYTFTVGGDDGYRLSLNGGSTWVINEWNDHAYTSSTYTVTLNGTYNMVLEYYENGGDNRISFQVSAPETNTSAYGTDHIWFGYVYDGTNFDTYAGKVTEGSLTDPSFSEDFGGSNVNYATNGNSVQTETFSVRYRLTESYLSGSYTFFVGGDDGYRLSFDGGNTWAINKWWDQSYNVTSYTTHLDGVYNMVLEFYENGGENRISFAYQYQSPLAISLISFNGLEKNKKAELNWEVSVDSDPKYFDLEKSTDGNNFSLAATVDGTAKTNTVSSFAYNFTDASPFPGKSYYRLKMVDMSGKVTYSQTVLISVNAEKKAETKVFPTVVTQKSVNVNTSEALNNVTVYLTDLSGKNLAVQQFGKVAAGQTVNFQFGSVQLTRGIYLVRIADNNQAINTQKIIVQ